MHYDIRNENCPSLSEVRAILFDMGDTLFDTSGLIDRALHKSAEYLFRRKMIANRAAFLSTYKEVDRTIQGPSVNHLFSNMEIIGRTWAALGLQVSPRALAMFLGFHRETIRRGIKRNVRLVQLLTMLRKLGYKIAVVTDGSTAEQIDQLFLLGVLEHLDGLVTSEQVGIEKPNKKLFQKAIAQINVEPGHAVMVGDDLQRDIRGAQSLGILTILVTQFARKNKILTSIRADVVIENVLEIENLLMR